MFPGETILSGAPDKCPDCGADLEFEVLCSAAGHYVGTQCCYGPVTRESNYYENGQNAHRALIVYMETGKLPGARR